MAATVADLPSDRFSELARYLGESSRAHPGDENEPLAYWELIAERLRRDNLREFGSYTDDVSCVH